MKLNSSLVAPDLVLLETATAWWKRVRLRNELSADEATLVYRDLLALPLSLSATGALADALLRWR
jgi:predicted nucleic acid-binding protein